MLDGSLELISFQVCSLILILSMLSQLFIHDFEASKIPGLRFIITVIIRITGCHDCTGLALWPAVNSHVFKLLILIFKN